MKKYIKIFFFLTAAALISFIFIKSCNCGNPALINTETSSKNLEIPFYNNGNQIVRHAAYTLQYNEINEQPDWVSYYLMKSRLNGGASRTDDFRVDPAIKSGSATLSDYKYSGYDRGHLAPAGDFTWSKTAMAESFFLSNMSPQAHTFNAGIWEKLENLVRSWANVNGDTLFITAGPILRNGLPTIGARNKLAVPEYFYKTILRKSAYGYDGVAFLIKHENSSRPLSDFAITIDSLEKITNINFFSKLHESTQSNVEASFDLNKWPGIMLKSGISKKRLVKK